MIHHTLSLDLSQVIKLEESDDEINLSGKEGWVKKSTNRFFNKWPTRYFVLESKCLYCYKTSSKTVLIGGVNFDKISVFLEPKAKTNELIIRPLSLKGFILLRFKTNQDLNSWTDTINYHIQVSRGKKKVLVDYPLWSLNRISVKEFKAQAESGDLILFTSNSLAQSLQRMITLSDYDHVGIIYRYKAGDIAFLESTKETGVSLCYWDDFISYNWYGEYKKIVYRKLEIDNRNEVTKKMDEFIGKVLGKKFSFGAKKLLSRFASGVKAGNGQFFCSELVAKAYQELEVIGKNAEAARFWPGDFGEFSRLKLARGRLLQEQIVDFRIKQSVLIN